MSRISCVRSTTRASSASSSDALLRRAELLVDEEHLRLRRCVRVLQLGELALADERLRVGTSSVLHELADRRHAGGARELAQLGELGLAVDSLREDTDDETALRLRPGCAIGLARSHRRIMPRYAPRVSALADRLAERTLELVNIPSESRRRSPDPRAPARARAAGARERSTPTTRRSSSSRSAAPARRSSSSQGTTTPCPPRRTSRAASRTARCTGSARAT